MAKSKKKAEEKPIVPVEPVAPPKPELPKKWAITSGAKSEPVVETPWGSYVVLDQGPGWKTKKIQVSPGRRFSLQTHEKREEFWFIVEGTGDTIMGDSAKPRHVVPGDMVLIYKGAPHRATCTSEKPLVFIEVQIGEYLGEDDIRRLSDDYGRK